MTFRELLADRPNRIDMSALVDEGSVASEASGHSDLLEAMRDTGDVLHYSRERSEKGVVYYIAWKPQVNHGRRLINARTNLEG
jgi:hypothetical protein